MNNKGTYNVRGIAAAIFMALTLLWLTVSIPFVYAAQQQQEAYAKVNPADHHLPETEDTSEPFANTAEEKAESGSSLSEYLQHINELTHLAGSLHKHNGSHSFSVYVAFHGELLCPPPNFTLS